VAYLPHARTVELRKPRNALNNRITSVYSSLLGDGQCQWNHTIGAMWDVFCAVGTNQQYNWVFCASSVWRLYNATLIISSSVQFLTRKVPDEAISSRWGEINAVTVLVRIQVNNSRRRSRQIRQRTGTRSREENEVSLRRTDVWLEGLIYV
jgi:hypothetical protein